MRITLLFAWLAISPLLLAAQHETTRPSATPKSSAVLNETLSLLRQAHADSDLGAVNYHYTRWFGACRAALESIPETTRNTIWELAASLEGFSFDPANPADDAIALKTLEQVTRLLTQALE